jgi:isoamyl acetate esterase
VRLLTIWFGANDACLPEYRQHVPLSRFSENLTTMVHTIRAPDSPWYSPETKLLLITPPPIHVPSMGVEGRTFDVTKTYAEEVKKVGEREDIPVLDVWTRMWEAAGKSEEGLEGYFTDGLHLAEAGYEVSVGAHSAIVYWTDILGADRIFRAGRGNNPVLSRTLPRECRERLSTMGLLL